MVNAMHTINISHILVTPPHYFLIKIFIYEFIYEIKYKAVPYTSLSTRIYQQGKNNFCLPGADNLGS